MRREKILIVDDSEMNRAILTDILGDGYDILEVEDGIQAVAALQNTGGDVDLVLLDIVMPRMDGFGVLEFMNRNKWIEDIPVIMVSAENGSAQIERAYELGVTDFIMRPFDASIVRRRVLNTLLLYAKQKKLMGMVEEQLYEKEKNSSTMVDILSHIVEFRNGESGQHVLHVRMITEFLLRRLRLITDQYNITETQISLITTASAMHDIGKIGIDEKILNKPGRLTDEEFAIMKTHSLIGAEMLDGINFHRDNPLVKTAYEICRWHHERYNGRGYPDGLKGEEIPISAQVVALADVYDALTSERVYKPPFPHDKAVKMILNGECGVFNPLLMQCLEENAADLVAFLSSGENDETEKFNFRNYADEIINGGGAGVVSDRTLRLLDYERMKNNFFLAMSEEIQFEYSNDSRILNVSSWGAKRLGVDEVILEPLQDEKLMSVIDGAEFLRLSDMLHHTTPEEPEIESECMVNCDGQWRWHRLVARSVWSLDAPPRYEGALGKFIDIHDTRTEIETLRDQASKDLLTGLLNLVTATEEIKNRLHDGKEYMLAIFDLDRFKQVNDNHGHQFGNEVLVHVSDCLEKGLRGDDISARVGGDEFMIFLECGSAQERVIRRIFELVSTNYNDFPVSVSMGVVRTADVGYDFSDLFHAADQALYAAKHNGRGRYCFYDASMKDMFSGRTEEVIDEIRSDMQGEEEPK